MQKATAEKSSKRKTTGTRKTAHKNGVLENIVTKATGDMQQIMREAGKRSRELMDSAGGEFSDATEAVAKVIRKKPLQSGGILLGVGVVLGLLMRRR
jgi:ElaB/YqjD/DUF883 family membrane-anchored ribosome-binding protein